VADLALILTNFPAAAVTGDSSPRLPALELLLARADVEPLSHGWRAWLAQRFGWPAQPPSAALVAEAFARHTASAHYWFATPLNLFAGLDSVHLHPAGLLELSAAEQQRLAEDFARVFAGSPWTLAPIGQRELLLTGPNLAATAAEPEALLVRAPDACMARGADAPALRRLGSEIELWLHEHPLNLERARRGALPITALWLWGGDTAAAAAASHAPAPQVYGADSYAAALCRLRGGALLPLPERVDEVLASVMHPHGPNRSAVVLLTLNTPALLERGLAAALAEFERLWLVLALQAVRARKLSLHCLLGARAYRLTWRHCIRVWRTRAPWWEGLN
jgi:hypothetical protein